MFFWIMRLEKAKDCDSPPGHVWGYLTLIESCPYLLYIVQPYNLTYCEKGFELKHECHFNVRGAEVDEVGISI